MENQKLFTKNFTLLMFGQIFSLFGSMILRFALSMYILDVTGSAAVFAGILAVTMIPTILLSPFGGILADRANRRNIMVILDLLSAVSVTVCMIAMSYTEIIPVITVLMLVLSVLGAFESPTVQACVPQMHSGDNVIKANAAVNQIAAVAGLIAPVLGSVLYTLVGLQPLMIVTAVCFFFTAGFECFIKLSFTKRTEKENLINIVKKDFSFSLQFIGQNKGILKLLLLAAVASFFMMGVAIVGMPYIVREILNLSPNYYGAAESAFGIAAIAGGITAGLLTSKLKTSRLYLFLAAAGIALLPAGLCFFFFQNIWIHYTSVVLSMCLAQFAACIFSIFAVSLIQQRTPEDLLGKIMSFAMTLSLCAQPLGQILYGFLFDFFHTNVYWVLITSSLIVALIGLMSKKTFAKLEAN